MERYEGNPSVVRMVRLLHLMAGSVPHIDIFLLPAV